MKVIDLLDGSMPNYLEDGHAHYRWARSIASKHTSESIHAFETLSVRNLDVPEQKFVFTTLESPQFDKVPLLAGPIHRCWRAIDGVAKPGHAEALVRATRLHIQQAFLFDSLLSYCYLKSRPKRDRYQTQLLEKIEQSSPTDVCYFDPFKFVPSSPFIGQIEVIETWVSGLDYEAYQPSYVRQHSAVDAELMSTLYATALVWFDRAMTLEQGAHATNIVAAASEAMHTASLFEGLRLADQAQKVASAKHGATGARIKHQKTDDLKSWALERSQGDSQLPKALARKLVHEIPGRLRNASNDPERLIYEALLAQRKRNRLGTNGNG